MIILAIKSDEKSFNFFFEITMTDVNYDDSIFSNEDDIVLINMVRAYNIKSIKNRFELSQVWDTLTSAYNKSTNQNYTKKQLQKRTSNIEYKHKKHKSNEVLLSKPIEQNTSEFSDAILQENSDSTDLDIDLEQQKLRVEIAKEMTEIKRAKTEDIRLQREEILLQVAKFRLIEAEKRTELITLELQQKKKQLMQ